MSAKGLGENGAAVPDIAAFGLGGRMCVMVQA